MPSKQVDLYLEQLVDAPLKDERSLMEFPFFSLQKQPRFDPLHYDDGKVKIAIEPGPKGIATIWDKDILIYLASIINDRLERGELMERTVRFPAYDFLKITGRGTGKRAYDLFLDALHRLRSTNILTSIEAGGSRERRGFGWIEDWRVLERIDKRGRKIMAGVEITLNRWMFDAIVKDRRVLTISPNYFGLTMGVERRLYELARKHVGRQPEWYIGLPRLAQKCGSNDTLRKFKFRLAKIIEHDRLPDYRLQFVASSDAVLPFPAKGGQLFVRFAPKRPVAAQPHKPNEPGTFADTPTSLRISINGFDEARRRFPGYDIEYLEGIWRDWSQQQKQGVRSPDKAFLAWCDCYAAQNPL